MKFIKLLAVVLFSTFLFSSSKAQTVSIVTPNGGEVLYACQTYNVTWNQTGSPSNYWNIDYSSNGGTTWTSVASNLLITTGTYLWTVPNLQSSTVVMRITDATNGTVTDQSNSNFTINIPITVTIPNGGESWTAGTSQTITWNAVGTSGSFNISYSINGGSSWISIVTNYPTGTGTYNWTVPNNPSTFAMVRVQDFVTGCMVDQSNANFTIVAATPILLTPNGSEILYINCSYNITWNTSTFYSTVKLEYSTNAGSTWVTIVPSTSNSGSYNWIVPNTASTSCLVRASNSADATSFDISNANFTIAPSVTVVAPNGTENLVGCSNYTIMWNKTTCVGNWNIAYSTNNGSTWTYIVTNLGNTGSNSQSYTWYVPNNLTTTQALIRVESYSSPGTYVDVSNAVFNINPNNNISVVTPNGGESWIGCSSYNIVWNKLAAPCNTGFDLYYSLNNGTTWNYITSVTDNGSTSQTYTWSVPNTLSSTQCLIQVRSSNWSNITDASNAVFTITPSADITVTAANGGEVWQGLTSHTITWTNLPAASGLYTVQYSINNGSSWNTLVTNYSGNSYNWVSVPNTPSTQCLIRVTDYLTPCKYDQSDATFTISPATPIMTAPNGGNIFNVGCTTNITWNTTTYYSTINLYYSINGGASYVAIATGISNSGVYSWAIPNFPSTNCLIKVANSADVSIFDVSDAVFTINVPLTVVAANGGENWLGCSTYNITWSKSSCIGSWNLYYSTNNGSTWNTIATNVANSGTTQNYAWQVPNGITSTQALIRVENYNTPAIVDQSDAVFNITPSNDITVAAPNGGETLTATSTYTITWTNLVGASGQYTLQYSTNNGASWSSIVTNVTGNSYNWTVPNTSSTTCLVRIYDYLNTCKFDQSDAVFTITPSGPVLLTPNGGETLYIACSYNITWAAATFFSNVMLEYSTNNGATWLPIIANTPNDGSHFWTVPNTVSANCLVRASNVADVSLNDVSDAIFTIAPAVTVTSPNGGETLTGCSNYTITWTKTTCVGNWNILYSTNAGATWTTIASNVGNTGVNNQSYNWYVPNNLSSTQGMIRVESYLSPGTYFDASNATFTFAPNQNITVVTPNGGEVWAGCSSYNITWTKMAAPCNTGFDLYYSLNNGSTYTYITSVTDNGLASQTYSWSVPNTLNSNQCLIQVRSSNWSNILDASNAVFTIAPSADITVTSPNGGEIWQGLTSHLITWTNLPAASGLYTVQYSINNGSTWNTLVTNYSGNSYNWLSVPNTPSTVCLIRVTDYLVPCKFDNSDAVFTISPATPILTAPNGGQVFNIGCSTSITWNSATYYSNVNLYYSIDNGATWLTIATNQANSGSYTWTISPTSALPSGNCLVKVANTSDLTVFDVSDANFTINVPMTVNTPNGGEAWLGCSTYNITWTKTTCVGAWNIAYSTNAGASWTNIVTGLATTGGATQTYAWSVPNTITTTQALIRVESATYPSYITDVSDAVFSITPSNDITVITPNGGEVIASLTSYNITWSNTPSVSGQYTLQYSINNGASWTTIVSNITGNSYAWSVPNLSSNQCLIKVIDYLNTCKFDNSDAVFTITPPTPILLTPNGGETLYIACSYNITWNPSTFISTVNLEYSTNGGITWLPISGGTGTPNDGLFSWTIPNTQSANCRVRASNSVDITIFDISDASFTIAPSVQVVTPNGGETLTGCTNVTITWNKTTCVGNWNILYSLNNGSTWTTIVSNLGNTAPNSQSYTWYVPNNLTTTQGLIKVESYLSPGSYFDQSNAVFTINPSNNIVVSTPNGGETWTTCQAYNITWTKSASPCNTGYDLYYSTNAGSTWNSITSVTDNGLASQTYSWTVPNTVPTTTQALIRVRSSNWTSVMDQSNAVFNINQNADITVTSPNGAEVWQGLSMHTITWTNSIFASGLYTVYYSTNGGSSWNMLVTNYSGNSYNWTLPNTPSTNCLVKVEDYLATCRYDNSNATFTISPATPILLTPNGGEVLNAGQTYNITWNSSTFYSNVFLYYSTNGGTTWNTIIASTGNTGSYIWTVPNANSTTCLVKAANVSDVTVFDVSNAVFTIKPAVKILTPNGGEILGGCTVTSITWERSPTWNNYRLEYSNNNGVTWYLINASYTTGANPATYVWTVPNIATNQALVRVIPNVIPAYVDVSDAVFTLSRPVTIIQPNLGGTMMVASTYNITWNSDGISNLYDIFYSTNGGSTFTNIVTAYNTTTNDYLWTVPNDPSTNCKIWVRDNTNTCKNDTSDIVFTISTTAPPITLLTPNGGQNLSGCFPYLITWTDSPTIGTYDLLYSTNSGSTWNTIVSGYITSTHDYLWNIPNTINSNNCLVRVRSTATPTIFDQSNSLLQIHYGNLIALPSDTTVCSGQTVQLNAYNGYNYTWTPSTGLSCTTCPNPVATPLATTTYTVTSNNAGCILTDTAHVSVFTASVAIAASPSTSICAGTNVTFTATPTNGGTLPAYQWYLNGSPVGTNSPSYANSSLANGDQVYVVLTSNAPCLVTTTANSPTLTMNVTSIPATPGTISGTNPVCSGTTNLYSITPVAGATTYTWTLPGGWTGTSTTPSINTTASTTSGNITVTAGNLCGASSAQTLAMVVNVIPATPGTITGPTTICSGTTNTYSIAAVSGATTYTWTLPGGWTGTSTTPSINGTASTTSGNVTVTAGNSCGNSAPQTLAIIVNTTPATPGSITGVTPICAGTTNTYSITAVGGATSYTWTMPGGWTGTSSTNSISATASATSGNVTVTANNGCGSSAPQIYAVVVNSIPATPGTISGSATVCQGSSNTYSISSVAGATSYVWTLPGGWSGTSTTTSIVTTASLTSGNVTVAANNMCGTSSPQILAVTVTPLPSVTAGGAATICEGTSTTLTSSGATTYSWLPTTGLSNPLIANPIASPTTTTTYTVSGTTSGCTTTATVTVTVTPLPVVSVSGTTTICDGGSTTITATGATTYAWSPGAGLSSTTIANPVANPTATTTYTVTGTAAGCSGTTTVTITVNPIPTVTASGTATICSGSSTPLSAGGGTTYSWLPATGLSNPSISNPSASPTTTTTYTVTGTTGGCSNTAIVTVTVNTVPANAGTDVSICAGASTTLGASGGTVYSWSPSAGLSATNVSNPVANPSSTTSYTVTVTAGSCSATDVVVVTVNALPTASAGSDASISCGGSTTLSASGGTSYAWSPGTGLSSTTIANPIASPSGTTTYTVTVTNGGCSGTDAVTITVGTLVANAGPDISTCPGNSVILNGSSTGGSPSPGGWISAVNYGNTGSSYGTDIAVDNAGNRYLVGHFTGTVAFGSFNLTASSQDMYIVKVSPAGTVLWANKGGGTSSDLGNAVAVDPSGNVYVTGYFQGTGTFNTFNLTSSGSSDVYVVKYNSAGVAQWAQKGGGTGADSGEGITANASGVWVTGDFTGTGTFGSTSLVSNAGTTDMFVAYYSSAGVVAWSARGGGNSASYTDKGWDVSYDASGNSYVCGWFAGTSATFPPLTVSSPGGSSDLDGFVAKYNSSGVIQWIRRGGNATFGEILRGIDIDGAGNIYCVGTLTGTASWGSFNLTSAGGSDGLIVKYNSAGTEQWAISFGGTNTDGISDIIVSPYSGNVMICGNGFSPSLTIGSTTLTGFNTSGDTYVAEFNAGTGAGISAIKSTAVAPGGNTPYGLGGDGNGNYYVAGTFGLSSTSVTFGPSVLTTAGSQDSFEAKFSMPTSGSFVWSPSTGLSCTTCISPTASPASTTTYVLTVTNGSCSDTDTVTVSVGTPTANAGSPVTICNGTSTTLNASGGTSYSWLPATGLSSTVIANPVANPTTTTTYTVTASTGGSCSATATVTVTVVPAVTANAGADIAIGCGGSATLSGSGGGTYSWSPATGLSNPNIANPVATPSSNITYTLTVSNGTCSSIDSVVVTVGSLTANAGPDMTICTGSSTVLLGSSSGGASGGPVNHLWVQGINGTGVDPAYGVASDVAGNTYVVGTYNSFPATFGSFTVSPAGSYDVYLAKYNSSGVCQWVRSMGGTGLDQGFGVALDGAGDPYLTGSFTGTATFGSTNLTATGGGSDVDMFIAKYNAAGTFQWARKGGATSSSDAGRSIAVDAAGNAVVGGSFNNTGIFGTFSVASLGLEEAFVVKYNSSGVEQWLTTGGGAGGDRTWGVTIDNSGNIGFTGYFWGPAAFGSTTLNSVGSGDIFIAKLSPTGTYIWAQSAGSASNNETGKVIDADAAGNFYMAGNFSSSVTFGSTVITSTGNMDCFIAKYNSAGVPQWAKKGGNIGNDDVLGIVTDGGGNSFISGNIAGTSTFGSFTLTGLGLSDVVLVAYSSTGIEQWAKIAGSTAADGGANISMDGTGRLYQAGYYGGTATFGALSPISTSGTSDGFVTQLSTTSGVTYSWSPPTGLSSTIIATPTASPTTTTTYTLTATSGSCVATDVVVVTVGPPPPAAASGTATICSGVSTPLTASGGTIYSWLPTTGLSNPNISNPIATPTSTTTYTVSVSNPGSCVATATVTITVNPTPVAFAGFDATVPCGGSTTLAATGGGTYSWSPATGLSNPNIANPVATPGVTTTYTVTVSNGTCSATDAVTITTGGTLTATASADVTICTGSSTTLTGSSTGGGGSYVNIATSYGFTQNVATYTAITGGTVFLNGASPSMDDVVSGAIAIPAFSFNNISYTSIYISTNGFITFGSAPTTTNYIPISSTETYAGAIAGWATDVNKATTGTPEIRYQTVGTEFVVQFRDVGRYNAGGTLDRVSFQIRLNTVGNVVRVVYAAPALVGAATFDPMVGLRGPNNTFATNVHNRRVISSTGPWVNSTQGTINTDVCFIDSSVPGTIPANGTTFTWTPSTGGPTTYLWTPSTGLSCTTCLSPVANPTTTTTYTFTATSGSCSAADVVTVTVGTSVANAGSDVTICTGGSTTLNATGATTYAWSPGTGLSSTTIANPVASPTSTTSYTVTATTGTCTSTDVVVVTVNPPPTANAGTDVAICTGGSTTLSASGGTTYSWLPAAGLSSTTIANPVANPTSTTSYTVTVANGTCTNTDVVVVTVNPAPTANAGTDAAICSGSSTTLSASGGTTYSWLPATGLSSTTIANPVANPTTTTSYTVTVGNGSCTATDVVVVTVNSVPANAGTDAAICPGGSTTLNATGGTAYSWSPGTGLNSTTIANPVANPTVTTSYTVTVTSGTCTATDVVVVSITTAPTANAGTDANICSGNSTTLSASGGTTYSWLPATGLSSTTIANPVANPSVTTSYTVTVGNGTCTATDVVDVIVTPTPLADAGTNVSICSGGNTTLNASGGATYSWIPATGLSATNIANPVASPVVTTTYTVIVSNGSCSATDFVTVTVNSMPVAPTSISGMNPTCAGTSQVYSVAVDPDIVSYSWVLPSGWSGTSSTNSISATVGTSGGVVLVTASNACGSATPATLNVTVNALPSVSMSSLGTICIDAMPFTITAGSPSGGIYSGTGVSNDTTFTASAAGSGTHTITYTFTDGNGCSNSASNTITVDLCTGLAGNTNIDGGIMVYPNPFTEYAMVVIDQNIQLNGAAIMVYDMLGKNVLNFTNISTYSITIERKDLQAGTYFYRFINADQVVSTGKLIIN